ncbi:MAG: hypothetical protein K0U23_08345, partial [Gammaproteobacteria bacterium]|nr:hypothetical protein [Gammaproteobacteria bacterium]
LSSSGTDFLSGAIIALILNIVIARGALLKGAVLEVGGCIFFTAMAILGLSLHHPDTFTQHPNLWSDIAMTIVMLGSVLMNKPFTSQYSSKGSHKLHIHLSLIWSGLLLLSTLLSISHVYLGLSNTISTAGTVLAIFLGVKANSSYPKWLNK